MKRAILFVMFAALCGAQTIVNGGRDYKGTLKASGSVSAVDFSGAGGTAPAKAGTTAARPTGCTQGQIYFATDVAAGQNLYFCTVTGAPGTWTQMSGNAATAITAGAGAPAGSCAPPTLYIDTTNQDLWFCGATNSWKKPTADTSGFPTLTGTNTWSGTNTLSSGQLKASGGVAVVDFSGAGSTAPAKAGTSASRPTACTQGQIYFATDVAAGQNLYFCTTTGAPGVWTQMSGTTTTTTIAGSGAPSGNCTPPVLYIDTTNQDLWFCGAANLWKRPTADTSGFPTLAGANTWTGYSNFSGGQWRPPESTVANLPAAAGNMGKVFMVTDAVSAGSCSTGGGSLRELCRANASTYECVGGCGSTSGGSGTTAYISSLITGPDSTKIIAGATHGFATTALLVAVYDNASPRNAISVGWTVNPSTYDVMIAFASPQSSYYVVVNGGVGPAGPTGPTGPAGPAGPGGSGSGNVNPSGTIVANRIATFADPTGNVIQDGTQHSIGSGYLSTTKTAGAGGVTANLLCKIDNTGNVVLPATNDVGVLGICVTTQATNQAVEVATRGIINCVADNNTTIGNVAIAGTVTAGRCRDSGQANTTGVSISTQVLGKVLTAVSAGQLASIQLYGPGHYGAAVQVSDGGTGQAAYTKGDLLVTPGGTVLNRLPAGTDGQALIADAASTNGVKWGNTGSRRTCIIDNDSQSATALMAAQLTGRCEIPFAAHIVEVGVWGGTGTGTQTYTGASSIQLMRLRPNGGTTAPVLSAALATPNSGTNSNKACATAASSGTCTNGLTSSSSVTLAGGATVAVNAGDVLYVSSATGDGVQTWFTITIVYTVD